MVSAPVKAQTCDVIMLGLLPPLGPEKQHNAELQMNQY